MWSGFVLWCCVLVGLVWGDESPVERVVRSPQGPVRGYKQPGDSIYVFYGIPYATAPPGRDKFKAPLPPPAWFSVFDAVDKGITCPQANVFNVTLPNITKKENCLIANVYVPETDQKSLPVVVYVHGGAYQLGSGAFIEAKHLVRSKKVILVTFNYRLGVHGFLCLGTPDAPGNAGMKDQIALLQWVKKNIASYGGNPKDVTIAGYSAGSSSVNLLVLSPSAKDLFQKAIHESGTSLSPWSVQVDPIENAKMFAKSLGFEEVDDFYALEEFYKSTSLDLLTSSSAFIYRTDVSFLFSPCVENKVGSGAFMTDSPYNILKSGNYKKIPMLHGFAAMEGLLRLPMFDLWTDKLNANFSEFLPVDLQFENIEEREEVSNKIKEFYFGDKPVSQDSSSILSYIDFMSDTYFVYSGLKAVELHFKSGHDQLYLYQYNFVDDSELPIPYTDNVKGATHCAQSIAIFDGINWMSREPQEQKEDEVNISDEYKNMKSVIREIWINFITYGVPVPAGSPLPAWPPVRADAGPHMSLDRSLELRGALLERRARFWAAIYERHYRMPQPPPAPPTRHTEL